MSMWPTLPTRPPKKNPGHHGSGESPWIAILHMYHHTSLWGSTGGNNWTLTAHRQTGLLRERMAPVQTTLRETTTTCTTQLNPSFLNVYFLICYNGTMLHYFCLKYCCKIVLCTSQFKILQWLLMAYKIKFQLFSWHQELPSPDNFLKLYWYFTFHTYWWWFHTYW